MPIGKLTFFLFSAHTNQNTCIVKWGASNGVLSQLACSVSINQLLFTTNIASTITLVVLGILQRVVKWWRCRCPGEWVRAAKLNLQQALNTRIPNAVLNFAFKLRYRQVSATWWSSIL